MSKELTKKDANGFAVVANKDGAAMIAEAFEQMGIDAMQLSRVKIPAGGVTQWAVNTLTGEVMEPTLEVIICGIKGNEKVWWAETFSGEGGPPSCSSHDGVTGWGVTELGSTAEPSAHACKDCPWNQWGSVRTGGPGKDCSDIAFAFFFRADSMLPEMLVIPPSSLKAVREYSMRLMSAGKNIRHVVTKLGLTKAKSKGGITYSQITADYVRDLEDGERETMGKIGETVMASLMQSPRVIEQTEI